MSITKKLTQYDDNEYKQPTRLAYQINTKAKSTKVNVKETNRRKEDNKNSSKLYQFNQFLINYLIKSGTM